MGKKTRVHVLISGKVQGVWYRASTQAKAQQLGITGWVRNTRDGKVEAVFEGDEATIQQMILWCHQGPPQAKVNTVEVREQPSSDSFHEFFIR